MIRALLYFLGAAAALALIVALISAVDYAVDGVWPWQTTREVSQ